MNPEALTAREHDHPHQRTAVPREFRWGPGPGPALYPESRLNPGDELVSDNGEYTLALNDDGNILVNAPGGFVAWSSNTVI